MNTAHSSPYSAGYDHLWLSFLLASVWLRGPSLALICADKSEIARHGMMQLSTMLMLISGFVGHSKVKAVARAGRRNTAGWYPVSAIIH